MASITKMKNYCVMVEKGKEESEGKPSKGPVYRSYLAKDGFPPPPTGIDTCWDVFNISYKKNPDNKMLGTREIVDGKAGNYVWMTYREVYNQVLCIGSAMRLCGVHPRGRCGIYGINCPEWVIAMEACNAHTVYCVPLYDTLGVDAVEYIVKHAEVSIVFVHEQKISEMLRSLPRCSDSVKTLVSFGVLTEDQKLAIENLGLSAYEWKDFLNMGKNDPVELALPKNTDICTIMYTSGTTGEPKGVLLTHESISLHIGGVDYFFDHFSEEKMTPNDSYLSFLPLAHIFDRIIEEYFIYWGASIGFWQGDKEKLGDDARALKPTLFVGVPKVYDRIYSTATRGINQAGLITKSLFSLLYNYKLFWMKLGYNQDKASPLADHILFKKVRNFLGGRIRLILSGGAPLAPHVEEFLRVATCSMVVQGYGLTETCAGSFCALPNDLSMIGTVGVPAPTIEVRLESVPEMGYDALGEVSRGEVCIRGKILFSGYYKRDDLTREVLVDGWFHTGDIGEWQPNGTLKIIDRKKNIFKLAQGEYVAVERLENIYGVCPYVESIWVYGNSFETSLVAVVIPNEYMLLKWANSQGLSGNLADLCKDKRVNNFILNELIATGRSLKVNGFEIVRAIHLDPFPFDLERDLLTPTFKKKRPQLLKFYEKVIKDLYDQLKRRSSRRSEGF